MSKFSLNTLGKLLADKSGLSQVEAELFIRKMFDVCNQGLDADKQVKIKWLGTFKVQATKDRESINVNTGERFIIEGRDKLTFTPDNILKEIVNKPFAQFETVVVNDGVDFDEIDEKFGEKQTEDAPAQVIDFLDEEETATPNPEVVVIGSEKEKDKEEEDELAKQIAIEQAKLERLKQAKLEQERIEQEKIEQERLEQERIEQERIEQERIEQERLEQERIEQERIEQERLEQERLKQAKQQQALKATVQPAVPVSDETEEEDDDDEEEESSNSHHIVIPRYLVVAVCLIVVALIGGIGWFAFNYGQMTAQRDHLAMQLNQYHQKPAKKATTNAAAAPLSQEQKLRQKAIEDSIRMAKTAEAVKLAEQSDEGSANAENSKQAEAKAKAEAAAKAKAEAKEKAKEKAKAEDKAASQIASSQYDKDARVRTGAYRIVGVAQTVTVGAGQTIEQISTRYLGSGMECYVEALNGTSTVKAGQKIKIPKLELKKKKK